MIDLTASKMPLDRAIEAFEKDSAPALKEYNRHRFFVPDRKSKRRSRHSGKGGGQYWKSTRKF